MSKQPCGCLGKKSARTCSGLKCMGFFKKRENPARSLVSCIPVEMVLLGQEYHKAQKELKASIPEWRHNANLLQAMFPSLILRLLRRETGNARLSQEYLWQGGIALCPGQILASLGAGNLSQNTPSWPRPESSEVFLAKQMKRFSSQNVNEQMKQSRHVKSDWQFPHTSLPVFPMLVFCPSGTHGNQF